MVKRLLTTAAWGVFCSCSWTWCIGMFLPVVLLREFGWPGVIAFAVPNVLGCAAFGYVLRSRSRREAWLNRHEAATRWFSIVAVAYNAFFVVVLVTTLAPAPPASGVGLAAGGAALALAVVLSFLPAAAWLVLAAVVYAASLATLAALGLGDLDAVPWRGDRNGLDLVWLAPVMVMGFLLCPYLDLTFHRALSASPSRHAFAVFAATFAVMLVLTCVYRNRIAIAIVPMAHLAAQAVFTMGAHVREVRRRHPPAAAVAIVVVVGGMLLGAAASTATAGEQGYLRFLAFYGLVFPAYVLLFLGPGPILDLRRGALVAYAVVMLACLPCFELAFFHDRMWLLIVPVAGLLGWKAGIVMRGEKA